MNRQGFITGALKRIGAAARKAQPPKPPADDPATIEFLTSQQRSKAVEATG